MFFRIYLEMNVEQPYRGNFNPEEYELRPVPPPGMMYVRRGEPMPAEIEYVQQGRPMPAYPPRRYVEPKKNREDENAVLKFLSDNKGLLITLVIIILLIWGLSSLFEGGIPGMVEGLLGGTVNLAGGLLGGVGDIGKGALGGLGGAVGSIGGAIGL